MVAKDIFFDPDRVALASDTAVRISLPNAGAADHNFSIDELGIDIDIAPGATKEIVLPGHAGQYEFYCNVPGHREAGMVGILTFE